MKKKLKQPFRNTHRLLGSIGAIFILVVLLTGITLQHPSWFTSNKLNSPFTYMVQIKEETWFGTQDGLYLQLTQKDPIRKVPLRLKQSSVVGLTLDNDTLLVAFEKGPILQRRKNKWAELPIPKNTHSIYSLSQVNSNVYLSTDTGLYLLESKGWKLLQNQLAQQNFLYTMKKIHTGYFFHDSVKWIYNIFAWITLGITLTGIILYFRKK